MPTVECKACRDLTQWDNPIEELWSASAYRQVCHPPKMGGKPFVKDSWVFEAADYR